MSWEIKPGDCLTVLKEMAPESVQCCVTSPPYWGLRDYGADGQLGLERTPEEYVAKMVEVFREVRRVLRDDGTLWLNLGDSYYGSWANYGGGNRGAGKQRLIKHGSSAVNPVWEGLEDWRPPASYKHDTIKAKDLVGMPWMTALALRADGWYLRQDIIWAKPNPMPESVTDRCTKAHEYLFLLSKSRRYYFDHVAIKEPAVGGKPGNTKPTKGGRAYDAGAAEHRTAANLHRIGAVEFRNRRSVWDVATRPYRGAHFATFPPDLIEPCIKAGSREGDTILDPFNGAGTTGLVAARLGRNYIGIELNTGYCEMSRQRISAGVGA